jgi:hyperosmotically inducible periplasmic protein
MKAVIGTGICAAMIVAGGLVSSTARLDAATPQAAAATSDKTLHSRIESRIHSDATLKKYNIDVDVDGGVATLTGTVATEADRAKAANLAKVNGVSRVDNKIVVDLNAATTGTAGTVKEKTKEGAAKTKDGAEKVWDKTKDGTEKGYEKTKDGAKVVGQKTKEGAVKVGDEVTDAYLISKLHADFVNEDVLKGSDINVDADNQVVTLKGTVMSPAGRARAVAIARGTKGVKRVVDQLTIGPKK